MTARRRKDKRPDQLPPRRIVRYTGYGRMAFPSAADPRTNYSVQVSEDREGVTCSCPKARSLSPGEPCDHGLEALRIVREYIDAQKLWKKSLQYELRDKSEVEEHPREGRWFSLAMRRPATEFAFPDGTIMKSRTNRARRRWGLRVPDLIQELIKGTASRLERLEFRHRVRRRDDGSTTIGAGCPPRLLRHKLYAVVSRAFNDSLADEANNLADSVIAGEHIGDSPSEGSICNYFHEPAVRTGLMIWLAATARAVWRLAQYVIVDSTGFSSSPVEVWRESSHGAIRIRATSSWLKAHVLSDAATNVILAIIPTSNRGHSADVSMMRNLIRFARAAGIRPRVILGDKAYLDKSVRDWCEERGMLLFVELKGHLTDASRAAWDRHNGVISRRTVFGTIMRFRPKIESVFASWKRMFNPYASTRVSKHFGKRRSGLSISQEIELLAKAVAYNLRRIATLEDVLDQDIDLARGEYFHPMPDQWVSPESTSLLTAPDLLDEAS